MITRMNHASFTVSNLDNSIDFYQKALGLELTSKAAREGDFAARVTGVPGASLMIAYLSGPDCAMELIQYLEPEGQKIDTRTCNVGSAHVAFNVDNFKGFLDSALASGARLSGEVATVPTGPNKGKQVVYLKDPDDNNIELLSNQVSDL